MVPEPFICAFCTDPDAWGLLLPVLLLIVALAAAALVVIYLLRRATAFDLLLDIRIVLKEYVIWHDARDVVENYAKTGKAG